MPAPPNPAAPPLAPDHFDIVIGNPDVAPAGVLRIAANGASGAAQASAAGAAYAALGGGGGLSSDTLLKATATMVGNALELLLSLTSATPGSETAQWQILLDKLGTLVSAMVIKPDGTYFPQGSAAAPSVSFQGDAVAQTSGFYWSQATSSLVAIINAATQMILQSNKMTLFSDSYQILMGTLGQVIVGCVSPANNAIFASTLGNMQMGSAGALATNATKGFLDLPTCAGAPTGTPSSTEAGHRSMVYDTTNHKIWVFDGTWKGVVVA